MWRGGDRRSITSFGQVCSELSAVGQACTGDLWKWRSKWSDVVMGNGEDVAIKSGRGIQSFWRVKGLNVKGSFLKKAGLAISRALYNGIKVWNLVKLNQESIKRCV